MKKKNVLIICIIIAVILAVLSFIANYVDKGRVSTGHEPKFTIKIVSDGGNKVTYWGLGYKVVRYPSVSPNEPYKNNLGVKMGSWFMKYELSDYENVKIELLMDGKEIEVDKKRDVEFIVSLLRDSKYIHELCDGINTHKIIIDDEVYYLKESCKEIQKGKKQAKISDEDLNSLLKIINDYNKDENEENKIAETITTTFATYHKMSDGTWEMNGNSYKYRLEINGRMPNAVLDSTYVYLSNIEEISFQKAYLAAGLSSSTVDYFSVEDAVFVDYFNVE